MSFKTKSVSSASATISDSSESESVFESDTGARITISNTSETGSDLDSVSSSVLHISSSTDIEYEPPASPQNPTPTYAKLLCCFTRCKKYYVNWLSFLFWTNLSSSTFVFMQFSSQSSQKKTLISFRFYLVFFRSLHSYELHLHAFHWSGFNLLLICSEFICGYKMHFKIKKLNVCID